MRKIWFALLFLCLISSAFAHTDEPGNGTIGVIAHTAEKSTYKIFYMLEEDGPVRLTVMNNDGVIYKQLINRKQKAGKYVSFYKLEDLPKGTYQFIFEVNGTFAVQQVYLR